MKKQKATVPTSLLETFQSLYDAMKEQYDSLDSQIASHKNSIKNITQMKKDIEADMDYLVGVGVTVTEVETGDESDGEDKEEIS